MLIPTAIEQVVAGNGAFTPLDVPYLFVWFDASDAATITESGGAVSGWADKSPNGYDAAQATGSAKPTTGTRTLNGLNVLDFDGGDYLAATCRGECPFATYAVIEPDSVSGDHTVIHAGATGSADWSLFLNTTTAFFFAGNTSTSGSATVGSAASVGVPLLMAMRFTNPAGRSAYMRAAGSEGSVGSPLNIGYTGVQIGANNTPGTFFDGKLAEILVYYGQVETDDDTAIRQYLAGKWGVTA